MNRMIRGFLFSSVVLGLAGCASHEGPPARQVKVAYVTELLGHKVHWPKHHHTLIYKVFEHSHIQKCQPTHKPDVWACSMYFIGTTNDREHPRVIELMKEGSNQWQLYH